MPGMFFVAKLYLPDGNIISGATLPGAPVIITGSNSYISWGITTENSDSADLCEELIQGESYIKDNIKYPLEISKEKIYIKGKKEIEIEIQSTFSLDFIKSTSYKFSSFESKNCFHEKKFHEFRFLFQNRFGEKRKRFFAF